MTVLIEQPLASPGSANNLLTSNLSRSLCLTYDKGCHRGWGYCCSARAAHHGGLHAGTLCLGCLGKGWGHSIRGFRENQGLHLSDLFMVWFSCKAKFRCSVKWRHEVRLSIYTPILSTRAIEKIEQCNVQGSNSQRTNRGGFGDIDGGWII